ncbi:Hint domain-containing protein, partial [Streptomyces phytophilus]|uniref:Hint domain-containing protein n=1 Tax=Streptomyces phytophilus TaxID=722715 RepID=UPI0028681F88
ITHADPTGLFWKGIIDFIQETVERAVIHQNSTRNSPSGGGGGGGGTTPATQATFTAAPSGGCVGMYVMKCLPDISQYWEDGEPVREAVEDLMLPDVGGAIDCVTAPGLTKECGAAFLETPWTKALGSVAKIGKRIGDKILDARRARKAEDPDVKPGSKSPKCESNSFTAGTPVLMADGTTKPIEDVKVGDKVLATDPETGKTSIETVTAEIVGTGSKNLVQITIDVDGKHGKRT